MFSCVFGPNDALVPPPDLHEQQTKPFFRADYFVGFVVNAAAGPAAASLVAVAFVYICEVFFVARQH